MNSIPSPASAGSPRPYWLTEECPVWCAGGHRDEDAPCDRRHSANWGPTVDLSLMTFTAREWELFRAFKAAVPNAQIGAPYFQIYVFQNVGESQPRISLQLNDDPERGAEATVAEIDDLISRLIEARDLASGHFTPQAPEAGA